MSSLAFDKQGKPFAFQRRTKKLLVRLFRNPSARGTCCQVLGADGQPLYVDPETDYVEFRRTVGQVPGLYRLDQCDEDGNELDDAQAAYVSIDVARNAQSADGGTGDVSPLVIIQQMAATQAEVMKAMAAQQAALMAATAEILRAPYRPAPVAMPAPELRNADSHAENDDRDDDEGDENDEDATPEHPATAALRMIEPHLPQLGGFLYEKFAEFLRHIYSKKTATSPAATPAPMPGSVPATAPTAPQPTGEPAGVAAGWSSTPATATPRAEDAAPVSTSPEAPVPASPAPMSPAPNVAPAGPQATTVAPTTPATVMDATPISTREQFAHLYAIRERLSPKERAIAENAISRMDPQMLAHWLAELSAMSVDEATTVIRGMLAEIQPPRGSKQQ
jgi:hypothetical protein